MNRAGLSPGNEQARVRPGSLNLDITHRLERRITPRFRFGKFNGSSSSQRPRGQGAVTANKDGVTRRNEGHAPWTKLQNP